MKVIAGFARLRVGFAFALVAATTIPLPAWAHVKWFCSTADVTRAPAALRYALTPTFLACVGAFLLMVFGGFLVDHWFGRRWPALASSGDRLSGGEEKLIRLATGAFFLCLWDKGAKVFWETGQAVLTPELVHNATWIHWVQFAVAVLVIWRPTCILAAAGMCTLYGFGIAEWGVFHMTDYVFLLGIAGYLALTSVASPRALRMRIPLIAGSLAFSLMWTAVEKWVYPQWTVAVLLEHPNLTAGFPWSVVTVIAGFVEFTLAFYLATGRGLLRIGAFAYSLIFIIAIPEFGHVDAVGHMPIVAIFWAVCLRGASPLQDSLRLSRRGAVLDAAAVSALYLTTIPILIAAYYGLQWLEYGR